MNGRTPAALEDVTGVSEVQVDEAAAARRVADGATAVPVVLAALDASDVPVASVTVSRPSLDDVYLRYAGRSFVEADERTRNDDDQPPQQRRGSARPRTPPHEGGLLMALALRHGYCMMGRELLALWRQPWWIAITLMQPIIWLLLFGAMFERVMDLPGFASDDYIQYLTPASSS